MIILISSLKRSAVPQINDSTTDGRCQLQLKYLLISGVKLGYALVHPFRYRASDEIHREPYRKIGYEKRRGEDKEHERLKGDPRIYEIRADVGEVDRAEVEKERARERPALDLIENACSRLNKGEKIGREDAHKEIEAVEHKCCAREVDREINYARDDGTEAAEHKTALKKFLYVLIHFNPILSFTAFI